MKDDGISDTDTIYKEIEHPFFSSRHFHIGKIRLNNFP